MLPPAPPPDPFLRSAMLCPRQRRAGAKAGRGSRLAHRRVGLLSQRRECPVTICTDDTVSAYRRRSTSPRARSCRGGGGGAQWHADVRLATSVQTEALCTPRQPLFLLIHVWCTRLCAASAAGRQPSQASRAGMQRVHAVPLRRRDLQQDLRCAVLRCDMLCRAVPPPPHRRLLHQDLVVQRGDAHVCLGHHHLNQVHQRLEEGPVLRGGEGAGGAGAAREQGWGREQQWGPKSRIRAPRVQAQPARAEEGMWEAAPRDRLICNPKTVSNGTNQGGRHPPRTCRAARRACQRRPPP